MLRVSRFENDSWIEGGTAVAPCDKVNDIAARKPVQISPVFRDCPVGDRCLAVH